MNRAVTRMLRTLIQLVAAGGLTGLVSAIVEGLSAYAAGIVLAAATLVVTFTQNMLEAHGTLSPVLESRPVPGPPS